MFKVSESPVSSYRCTTVHTNDRSPRPCSNQERCFRSSTSTIGVRHTRSCNTPDLVIYSRLRGAITSKTLQGHQIKKKSKQKRQNRRQSVVAGRQQLYCAVQSRSPSHCQTTTGKVQSSARDGTSSVNSQCYKPGQQLLGTR